ncbi:MAG: hypothetical protein INR71_04750, partial [Terriglobus roseus]|nr:hypothetical protein [Terriglobus roseus]
MNLFLRANACNGIHNLHDVMDGDDLAAEDEALRQFLPSSFGKQSKETNVKAQLDQTRRQPQKTLVQYAADSDDDSGSSDGPGPKVNSKNGDEEGDDDDDDDDDEEEEEEFPTSHELVLKTHERAVTTVTLDPSGTRLITGSNDCTLKFHDFPSMTPTTLRAFKSVDPTATKGSANVEIHPVHHVEFNP